jgi:ribose transport system substrate-binding protein
VEEIMKSGFWWIVGIAGVLALAGCGSGDNGSGAASGKGEGGKKKYVVVFSQCNNAEPYRAAQNDLMTKLWAAKGDVDFSIQDAQQDNKKQADQIATIIRTKPDLLIVAPNERDPLTKPMKDAMDAGIKVICLERDIAQPYYTTFIKCDNTAIGRLAGQFIVDSLKKKYGEPKGNIVQLQGLLGVQAEHERNDGAAEVYGKYPGIKVVHTAVADWIQSKAKDRMTEALNANPHIDVVYGHNDPMAIGAYLAAKEKGRDKEMIFIGVDGLAGAEGGIEKVKDGVLAATFVYPLCVDKAVEVGYKMLTDPSFKPDKEYVMPSEAVTPDNAAKLLEEKK